MFVRPKRDWRTTGFYIAACMSVGLHVYLNEVLVGLNMYRLIQTGSNLFKFVLNDHNGS